MVRVGDRPVKGFERIEIWVKCSRANPLGDCEVGSGGMPDISEGQREVISGLRPHYAGDHVWGQANSGKLVRLLLNGGLSRHDRCLSAIVTSRIDVGGSLNLSPIGIVPEADKAQNCDAQSYPIIAVALLCLSVICTGIGCYIWLFISRGNRSPWLLLASFGLIIAGWFFFNHGMDLIYFRCVNATYLNSCVRINSGDFRNKSISQAILESGWPDRWRSDRRSYKHLQCYLQVPWRLSALVSRSLAWVFA